MLKTAFTILLFIGSLNFCAAQSPDSLLLKNYRPHAIYKIPVTKITKAKYPVIDMHAHPGNVKSDAQLNEWVSRMDRFGVEKTIILTMLTGAAFDSVYKAYARYGDKFEVWCGFDYTGYNEPGWAEKAVRELERCAKLGAKGVGELGDKGLGEVFSEPVPAYGMHIDDPRMKPLFEKCGELKLPVNVHVAEPMWMYQPMDSTNDGLMNAYSWKVDQTKPGFLGHGALIKTLENVVRDNPGTTFIACHLANCEYDLSILGRLLSRYKNLYADFAARYAELSPIPRYMYSFFEKYQDKLVYGTDMQATDYMYETTFRILETTDEHFYAIDLTGYHWPLHGFGLSDTVLKKIYKTNAAKILSRK
ncbi:amidohydrolase [Dyadobacter sp. CY261]|uniref:amidohydrolase family protein n=1 Tax=Dyadobacter sp. CY261 TaxID=2907203 RepID=UPI001F1E3393|nr:amidohydrolase family protein [Dyadobacter sp. CY261]MCF0074919.1 amidohydrolase [Dyadobacter sp. CY261]